MGKIKSAWWFRRLAIAFLIGLGANSLWAESSTLNQPRFMLTAGVQHEAGDLAEDVNIRQPTFTGAFSFRLAFLHENFGTETNLSHIRNQSNSNSKLHQMGFRADITKVAVGQFLLFALPFRDDVLLIPKFGLGRLFTASEVTERRTGEVTHFNGDAALGLSYGLDLLWGLNSRFELAVSYLNVFEDYSTANVYVHLFHLGVSVRL